MESTQVATILDEQSQSDAEQENCDATPEEEVAFGDTHSTSPS
jgi:hypothetical protein